ncbi:nitrophenyl compound nitroreductase subunit ArsF family protein [Carboxylicivirga taeanensis]|uniref:nitrophenyl compound nitroreductase subunit ArsF family protein n=1 Tax=Carboxylicivirga taeanensis TaxID=1416875 RepID=UPI003F6DC112
MNLHKTNRILLGTIALFAVLASACNTSGKTDTKTKACCSTDSNTPTVSSINTEKLSVLYFHASRRCATCEAVEKVTKETLTELFNDTIPFYSINREEQKELAKKFNVEWQTLIVTKGNEIINLTNEAFLNARTKPEKLKASIQSTINSMR